MRITEADYHIRSHCEGLVGAVVGRNDAYQFDARETTDDGGLP